MLFSASARNEERGIMPRDGGIGAGIVRMRSVRVRLIVADYSASGGALSVKSAGAMSAFYRRSYYHKDDALDGGASVYTRR